MPELPEMEHYKNLLTAKIAGNTITAAEISREKSVNVPVQMFIQQAVGSQVTSIERKAKHLLFHLSSGHVLLLHLMLDGWMFYGRDEEKPDRTVQVRLSFGGNNLYFLGLRLGYLHLYTETAVRQQLSNLGPEPLDDHFTETVFQRMMSGKRGILKTSLVDQHFISGIGNCYSDEICFDAGLLPTRSVSALNEKELSGLYHSIRSLLKEATDYGGYMEYPFFVGDALTGKYDSKCRVYDLEGKPCLRCGSPIVKQLVSSRKCFYCPGCQR